MTELELQVLEAQMRKSVEDDLHVLNLVPQYKDRVWVYVMWMWEHGTTHPPDVERSYAENERYIRLRWEFTDNRRVIVGLFNKVTIVRVISPDWDRAQHLSPRETPNEEAAQAVTEFNTLLRAQEKERS